MKKGYFRRVAANVCNGSIVAATLFTAYAPEKVATVAVALLQEPNAEPQPTRWPYGSLVVPEKWSIAPK